MATQTEATNVGDVVKYDQEIFSREEHDIASGQTLDIGSVCETVGGDKVVLSATVANADSISLQKVTTTSIVKGAFLVRHGVLKQERLNYEGGDGDKAGTNAALAALGMHVRSGLS